LPKILYILPLRTSAEIYYQLTWDGRFEARQYLLGIQTRRGVREVAVVDFDPHGDIPWHRILYVRGPQGLVWDRARRLDILTPPAPVGVVPKAAQDMLVTSWNCCSGRHGLDLPGRLQAMVAWLQEQKADLIALQEAGPQLREMLPAGWHCFCHGELALLSRQPPLHQRALSLPFGKSALLAQWPSFDRVGRVPAPPGSSLRPARGTGMGGAGRLLGWRRFLASGCPLGLGSSRGGETLPGCRCGGHASVGAGPAGAQLDPLGEFQQPGPIAS
jgi:uncharacterized protein (UPF0248 family)